MQGVALLVALSALGIDQTWRQTDDGQVEYVLQIEPVFLSALAEGKEIDGQLPAELERLDRVCIRIGSGGFRTLAKTAPDWPELNQAAEKRAAGTPPPDAPLAVYAKADGELFASQDLTHGWEPASEIETTYLIQIDPKLLELLEEGDEIYAAVLPEAGVVSRFKVTSGRERIPRQTARPPVRTVAQLQAQGTRTSSPAADVPPTSDFTGGETSSIYGPEVTDLGTDAAGNKAGVDQLGQGSGGMLQPPVNRAPLDRSGEVPAFDRSGFAKNTPLSGSGVRPGTSRTTNRSVGAKPPPRQSTSRPVENAGYEPPEDEIPQMASRTTGTSNVGQDGLPQRRANSPAGSAAEGKEPEFPALPFTLSLFALFLSIGANLYLGWTAAEFYSRYKLAVERLRSAGRS